MDKGRPFVGLAVVVAGTAIDDIAVTVAVHIARRTDRVAAIGIDLPTFYGAQEGIPLVDEDSPFSAPNDTGPVRSTDHEIAVAIIVGESGTGYRPAEVSARHIAFQIGPISKAGQRAIVQIDPPLVGLSVIEIRNADRDIAESVVVSIAIHCDRPTEPRIYLIRFERVVVTVGQSDRRTMVNEGSSFVRLTVVVGRSTDHDVGIAVTVHIAAARYRITEFSRYQIDVKNRGVGRRDTGRRTVVDEDRSFVDLAVVITRSADDEIAVAVTVKVACGGYRGAVTRVCLIRVDPADRHQTGRRTVIEPDESFVGIAVIVERCGNRDIAETVAVHIAEMDYRGTVSCVGHIVLIAGGVSRRDTAGRTMIDKGRAFIHLSIVVHMRADNDIGKTVAVHISRP